MTAEVLETYEADGYTVELQHEDQTYSVVCRSGSDEESETFACYPSAYAGYRTVVRQAFGVNLPYKAAFAEASQETTAEDVLFHHYALIQAAGIGTDEATNRLRAMAIDADFVRFAPEILSLANTNTGWICAMIKRVCRVVIKVQHERAVSVVKDNPNFGRF